MSDPDLMTIDQLWAAIKKRTSSAILSTILPSNSKTTDNLQCFFHGGSVECMGLLSYSSTVMTRKFHEQLGPTTLCQIGDELSGALPCGHSVNSIVADGENTPYCQECYNAK